MRLGTIRWAGSALAVTGIALVLLLHYLVLFVVSTEAEQGIVQRIFYVHVPSAWVAFFAFGICAVCSIVYLWLGDERLDMAAVSAAEGGMVFTTVVLLTGPVWGKIAWGTYWTWDPRLTLTLLLWFVFLGYFLVRSSTVNPERGRRLAAIVAVVGVADIPFIHVSVTWLRSLHPPPVFLNPDGPTLETDMMLTLLLGFLAFTLLFLGLFLFRLGLERVSRHVDGVQGGRR